LNRKAEIRNVQKSDEQLFFFDWNIPCENLVIKGGYRSMISKAYKAAYDQGVGMNYNEDENKIHVWTDKPGSDTECKKGEVSKTIGKIIGKRHFARLCSQKSRGQRFDTFRNSMVSNFYIGNEKVPLLNGIMRFAIRSRNDTLWIPAKKLQFLGV
jgi:hypothetical protein